MSAFRGPVLALGATLLVAALVAAACNDGDGSGTPSPADQSPTAEAAAGTEYPLTVTDMLGRSVTIDAPPQTVAALSPTTVELVYAVGGTSATRSSSVTYPEEATAATDIGPSYEPNFELVVAETPDLIVADSMLQPQLVQNLEALNVPVVYAGASSFDDILTGLRLVGQVLDMSAGAEAVVADLEQTVAEIEAKLPADHAKLLVLNGAPEDFYAAKPESYVGNLAEMLGCANVAANAPDVGRFPGYTKLSMETIVSDAPEVVLAITAGPPGGATITDSLSSSAAWADVPAVQNGRVAEISAELFLQAPGPRVGEALNELAKLLYPEVFGS